MEQEVVICDDQFVIFGSGGQRIAHFSQPPVASGVDGEDRSDTRRELGGRFAADQDFELRNLERADGFDLTGQFSGPLAVGDDEERPAGFALPNPDLLGRTNR